MYLIDEEEIIRILQQYALDSGAIEIGYYRSKLHCDANIDADGKVTYQEGKPAFSFSMTPIDDDEEE